MKKPYAISVLVVLIGTALGWALFLDIFSAEKYDMYNSDGKCLIQISDYEVFLNLIHLVDDILRLAEVTEGVSINRAKKRFQGLKCGGLQQ